MAHTPERNRRRLSGGQSSFLEIQGTVFVNVLEISDPHDLAPRERQTMMGRLRRRVGVAVSSPQLYCYAKLGIVTEEGILVGGRLQRTPVTACASGASVISLPPGQNSFPCVDSENLLRVAVVLTAGSTEEASEAYMNTETNNTSTVAATGDSYGHATIPLIRLESGRRVVQWYPLQRAPSSQEWTPFPTIATSSSSEATEGAAPEPVVRASVKLEILFEADSVVSPQAREQRDWRADANAKAQAHSVKLASDITGVDTEAPDGTAAGMRHPHSTAHRNRRRRSGPQKLRGIDRINSKQKDEETFDEVMKDYQLALSSANVDNNETETWDDRYVCSKDREGVNVAMAAREGIGGKDDYSAAIGFDAMRLMRSNAGDSNSNSDCSSSDGDEAIAIPNTNAHAHTLADFDSFRNIYTHVPNYGNRDGLSKTLKDGNDSSSGDSENDKGRNKLTDTDKDKAKGLEEEVIEDGAHRVPVGLVDYVLLLGPTSNTVRKDQLGMSCPSPISYSSPVSAPTLSSPSSASSGVASPKPKTPSPGASTANNNGAPTSYVNIIKSSFNGLRARSFSKASPSGGSSSTGVNSSGGAAVGYVAGSSHGLDRSGGRGSLHNNSNHSGGTGAGAGGRRNTLMMSNNSHASMGSTRPVWDPVVMWDRFPQTDHADMPLAEQLGYFACPQGCISEVSACRPEPRYSSFVLSAGGNDEQFGVTLAFFVQRACCGPSSAPSTNNSNDNGGSKYACVPNSSVPTKDNGRMWVDADLPTSPGSGVVCQWDALTLCLVSRFPYVTQFHALLRHYYRTQLHHALQTHERQMQNQNYASALQNPVASMPSTSNSSTGTKKGRGASMVEGLNLSVRVPMDDLPLPCKIQLDLEHLLVFLTLECPVSVPGVYCVALRLPSAEEGSIKGKKELGAISGAYSLKTSTNTSSSSDSESSIESNITSVSVKAPFSVDASASPAETVLFARTASSDLPRCPYSIFAVVSALGPRNTVDLLAAALAESKILFHSRDLSVLPAVCEALRSLMYPMQWVHVYVPLVPAHLLDLVEAPVPFILGTHSGWLEHIPPDCLRDAVIVDVDAGTLDYGCWQGAKSAEMPRGGGGSRSFGASLLRFPADTDRWLVLALGLLLYKGAGDGDSFVDSPLGEFTANSTSSDECFLGTEAILSADISAARTAARDAAIQVLIFDTLLQFLAPVPECLFYLSERLPIFNRPLLLAETPSLSSRWFLQQLSDTNCFHAFTESIPHSKNLVFFRKAAARVKSMQALLDAGNEDMLTSSSVNCNINAGSRRITRENSSGFGSTSTSSNSSSLPLWVEASYAYAVRCRRQANACVALPFLREALLFRLQLHLPHVQWLRVAQGATVDPVVYLNMSPQFGLLPSALTIAMAPSRDDNSVSQAWSATSSSDSSGAVSKALSVVATKDSTTRASSFGIARFMFVAPVGADAWEQGEGNPAFRRAVYSIGGSSVPNQIFPDAAQMQNAHSPSPSPSPQSRTKTTVVTSAPSGFASPAFPSSSRASFDVPTLVRVVSNMQTWTLDSLVAEQGFSSTQVVRSFLQTFRIRSSSHAPEKDVNRKNGVDMALGLGADAMRMVSVARAGRSPPPRTSFQDNDNSVEQGQGRGVNKMLSKDSSRVSEFLTNLISDDNPQKLDSLLEGCLLALCSLGGRRLLLRLLREAKKERNRAGAGSIFGATTSAQVGVKSNVRQNTNPPDVTSMYTVYGFHLVDEGDASGGAGADSQARVSKLSRSLRAFPLNYTAFEALTICFLEILQHCTHSEDYSTAYDLLEVGGLYFLYTGDDGDEGGELNPGGAPFLSSQIYHHPIYQATCLWQTELNRRVVLLPTPEGSTMAQFDAEVVLEVRGLLTIMFDMDVNFERATVFIQSVATDYGLNMIVYLDLARFTRRLYDRDDDETDMERDNEDIIATTSDLNDAGGNRSVGSAHGLVLPAEDDLEEDDELLTNMMGFDIVDQTHLRQRRASLIGYMNVRQELLGITGGGVGVANSQSSVAAGGNGEENMKA